MLGSKDISVANVMKRDLDEDIEIIILFSVYYICRDMRCEKKKSRKCYGYYAECNQWT